MLVFFSGDIVCERRGSREKYKQTNIPITVNILYFRLSIYHYIPQSLQKFLESSKLSRTWGDATSFFSSIVMIWLSFEHRSANSKWNKTRQLWPQQSLFELRFDWQITFWIRVLWENPKVRILNRTDLECKGVRATKRVSIPMHSFRCAHFRALESDLLFLSEDRFSFPVVIRFLSACRSQNYSLT